MSISASMVKDLRERTGAGMLDCKKALEENSGDLEKALDWLRQKGLSKAAKKSGRATSEGLIGCSLAADGKRGVLVEVKCETDFVARGDKFQDFVKNVVTQVATTFTVDNAALLAQPWHLDKSTTVQDVLSNSIATIGENMQIGRAAEVTAPAGMVGSYIHSNGKIAVLVEVKADQINDAVRTVAKNVSMQIAAASPLALEQASLDPAVLEREREVYRQKAREEGKPDAIVEKIADGAVKKFCKEVCLLDQLYIRDDKLTIADVLKAASKEAGCTISLGRFVRLQLGVE